MQPGKLTTYAALGVVLSLALPMIDSPRIVIMPLTAVSEVLGRGWRRMDVTGPFLALTIILPHLYALVLCSFGRFFKHLPELRGQILSGLILFGGAATVVTTFLAGLDGGSLTWLMAPGVLYGGTAVGVLVILRFMGRPFKVLEREAAILGALGACAWFGFWIAVAYIYMGGVDLRFGIWVAEAFSLAMLAGTIIDWLHVSNIPTEPMEPAA